MSDEAKLYLNINFIDLAEYNHKQQTQVYYSSVMLRFLKISDLPLDELKIKSRSTNYTFVKFKSIRKTLQYIVLG